MSATSTADPTRRSARLGSALSAGVVSVIAGGAAYLGVAIAFTVARGNADAGALAASAGYIAAAFVAPIVIVRFLARSRGWGWWRAIRFAAVVSLLVHVALMPVALAALAM